VTKRFNHAGAGQEVSQRISTARRLATIIFLIVPFLGLVAAIVFLWGRGFHWVELGLLLGMYAATILGVTIGFHRLFTHRSFETGPALQFVLAVLGSMAFEGPILNWVAVHRRHHQFSDLHEDPHSPHHEGQGILGLLRGLWHAHVGWLFQPEAPDLLRYVKDLRQSGLLRRVNALFPVWVALGLLIPTVLGFVFTGTWMGAVFGLVWGGLVRIFLVHHVTWSINSICHMWGRRPFPTHDHSRNNFLFGVLGFGEGWHNNHHAFPSSARHGLRWWQIDLTYAIICVFAWLGLVWQVNLPMKRDVATP